MIAFLSRIVRIIVALLLIRILLRFVALGIRGSGVETGAKGHKGPSLDLVRDRVCNTFLPRDRAMTAVVGGREEHFCSAACRDRARAAFSAAS